MAFQVLGAGGYTHAQVLDFNQRTIYHSPETPGYTAWVGLWKLPDETIQIDFTQGTGPTSNPVITFPHLETVDAGATWNSTPLPTRSSYGMTVTSDGTMVRPVKDFEFGPTGILQPAFDLGYVERSTDGGATWSDRIDLVSAVDYREVWPSRIRTLSDGRLVLMASLVASDVPDNLVFTNRVKTMFVSSDKGVTWGEPITLMSLEEGVNEESDFVELPNGDLHWIHRAQLPTGVEERRQSLVRKVGGTFVPNPPDAQQPFFGIGFPELLMTDTGVIIDFEFTGSFWSDDLGQTWNSLIVNGAPLQTSYYPRAAQAADGTIVVVGHLGADYQYGSFDGAIIQQTFRLVTDTLTPEEWAADVSGDLNIHSNWTPITTPHGKTRTLIFGNAITVPQTVFTETAVSVKEIRFDNTNSYAIVGMGSVNLETSSGIVTIDVLAGSHEFQTVVNLDSSTGVDVADGASLTFNNALNLNGNTLIKGGVGAMIINNALNTGGGSIVVTAGALGGSGEVVGDLYNNAGTVTPGNSPGVITVNGVYAQSEAGALLIEIGGTQVGVEHDLLIVTGTAELAGTLEVELLNGFKPARADRFSIFDFGSVKGAFDDIILPPLGEGLFWDTSQIWVDGSLVILVDTPEPVSVTLLGIALCFAALARYQGRG